jgi:diphthamide synthase subunit DPH2
MTLVPAVRERNTRGVTGNKSMKIAICGSLDFTYEIEKLENELRRMGFEVCIPISSEKILRGEFSLEEIKKEKENGKFSDRAIKYDSIRAYWGVIKSCDCILVANYDKNGIKNYIGGNSFLEMGFAHILQKRIFLFNDIPVMIYSDEIKAMQPTIISGNLLKIR